ncbi:large ribosomal subunit protein mL49-like [Pocillopora verrucosa]|uniref:Large ribosomal subunit protein mL49 n=1 Tax=Pocillopora damicornis TaxID=46731 RepID=A0A3M6UFJ3_POCDA|nr:39S ribosomal protein L49, mitochondrial-like [Pocillopora damicornis]XP_058965258.1 large ribosomal subunit protein mL49-like [Pocillopora verrucosa]RMX52395.1 hypothetical protein pdam_00021106 [Pocillopora damicornis]
MAATVAAAFSKVCRSFISSNPALQSPTARGLAKDTLPCLRRLVHTDGISYEFKPDRLKQINASPSGWVPPATEKPNLPFFIKRSKYNNIPVYTDYRSGRTRKLTIIRRVKGDLKALEECLKSHLGNDIITSRNELTSQVKIRGSYKDEVFTLLKRLGF